MPQGEALLGRRSQIDDARPDRATGGAPRDREGIGPELKCIGREIGAGPAQLVIDNINDPLFRSIRRSIEPRRASVRGGVLPAPGEGIDNTLAMEAALSSQGITNMTPAI